MSKRLLTAAFAACLFGLIVGAKWSTFDHFGSPMPDWDQWDAEAAELFIPWFEHDHFAAHLFHPHNEHRVVLTKLQNLALGLLNGQWDSRLEAATNALLHAALAVAFWICACGWVQATGYGRQVTGGGNKNGTLPVPRPLSPVPCLLFLLTAVLFGLPLAWQNVLGGFHSQQYWLLALSFAAIVLLPFARPGNVRWWFGAIAAALALGSMGSGFLAAAVVTLVVIWRTIRGETKWRATAPTLALCGVVIVVGLLTRVEVPWHQDLKAKSVHDFVFSIVHSMEWPLRDAGWAALVMWLPWLLVAWGLLAGARRQPPFAAIQAAGAAAPDKHAPQIIVALGGWVLVQVLATAYARGVGADYPASRYMDTLAFGAMVNGAAFAWLLATTTSHRRASAADANELFSLWSVVPTLTALAWLVTLGFGLYEVTARNLRYELPDAKKYYVKAEGHMRRYLGSNDPKQLAYPDIPFPSAEGLIERLSHPKLRALMPVPIRAPLPMTASAATQAFQENDARGADVDHPPRSGLSPRTPPLDFTPTWGSFVDGAGAAATGTWRSAPIQSTLGGWLKFETAGQIGDPNDGVLLELHDARTDALLARVRPDRMPGDFWRAAYVRSPRQPFVVVAIDQHAARWLAFSGPVEMGRLSYWAWRATRHGLALVYTAATSSLILAGIALLRRAGKTHSVRTSAQS